MSAQPCGCDPELMKNGVVIGWLCERHRDALAVLKAIVQELDQQVWSPDTLDRIAEHLRRGGYEIREPKDE